MTKSKPVRFPGNLRVLELANNSHAEVARALGYEDRRNVWPWTTGRRPFPPNHCRTLVSKWPQLSLRDLRPNDYHLIWPELAPAKKGRANA